MRSLEHAVIVRHRGDADAIIVENAAVPLALRLPMFGLRSPFSDGFFVAPQRQRQQVVWIGEALKALNGNESGGTIQLDRLDLIAAFVAVAEQGSFVGAARKLARSPAAMTRAIAALEEQYAVQLLNRTTRAVALTDAGERYFQQAKRFLSDYDELEEAIQGERVVPKGELPIVASFVAEHPAVDVDLVLLDRMVSYVDEGIALGVRIGALPDSSLKATRVGSVRRVFCASREYLARDGEPKSLDDLDRHAIVVATGSSVQQTEWLLRRGGARRTPKLIDADEPNGCAFNDERLGDRETDTASRAGYEGHLVS